MRKPQHRIFYFHALLMLRLTFHHSDCRGSFRKTACGEFKSMAHTLTSGPDKSLVDLLAFILPDIPFLCCLYYILSGCG